MITSQEPVNPVDARLESLRRISWKGDVLIPLPSRSVIEFTQLCRRPMVSLTELGEAARQEPGITAELLRQVNSSLYGLRSKVTCVSKAIGMLGIAYSASIVLTSALTKSLMKVESSLLRAQVFRRDSIERAIFSRTIASLLRLPAAEAYTAAMLQDVLLPTLLIQHEADYQEYLDCPYEGGLVEFERERFGWTHAELAARTLLEWGFDRQTVLAVLDHHESPENLLMSSAEPNLAMACAITSLLMDPLKQVPDGVTRLVDFQRLMPEFRLLEIASKVDKEVQNLSPSLTNSTPLSVRIQEAMLDQIEVRQSHQVAPGRQFGNYVLQEQLAESSMGAIYKARHINMRRPSAVKILRLDRMTAKSIASFEQEVQITSTLRSPHTISVFDFGMTPDDLFYYAMEFIDGYTLDSLVKMSGPLPDGRVAKLLQQVCSSLAEAHASGLIHRDIKPDNIMVSHMWGAGDHATVLDFGLVKVTEGHLPPDDAEHSSIVGTPLYMSPEAALSQPQIDTRSDLYSLGATAYHLLAGRPVFNGHTVLEVIKQHIESPPVPLQDIVGDTVSPELCQLIMSCLEKDPLRRPASAGHIGIALESCVLRTPWNVEQANAWWKQAEVAPPVASAQQPTGELVDKTIVTG